MDVDFVGVAGRVPHQIKHLMNVWKQHRKDLQEARVRLAGTAWDHIHTRTASLAHRLRAKVGADAVLRVLVTWPSNVLSVKQA
jgi:hypothetical protein